MVAENYILTIFHNKINTTLMSTREFYQKFKTNLTNIYIYIYIYRERERERERESIMYSSTYLSVYHHVHAWELPDNESVLPSSDICHTFQRMC